MIFISDNDLTIRVQRLRRTDPVGGYTLYMHYGMGNRYYTLPVEDTGDEYVMVFVIPASFTRGLASGEYAYSIMADSRIVTSGMARKKEVNFPADTVYTGTVESGNRYTVLISAPVGGFLYIDGERYQTYRESVPEGREILVQAVPDEHHTFDQWSDGETENPRTVVVNNDITLAASFEAVEYTVSISAGSNGSVSVNGVQGDYSQTVPYGTVLTIEGTGSTGYGFTGWSDGSLENPRQYTVEGDTTLTASFALGTYIVTITSGFNGSVSVNGVQGDYSQAVQHGTQLTVEALPDTGYSFDQWTDGNTDNPRTITVTGPITLSSAYEALTYSVSVSAGANGSVSVNGTIGNYSETVAYGTVLTIEGTGSTGYGFDQWSDGNTDNPRTLTVTGDVTLTASFAVGMYRVNISAGQNGSVEVDGISGDYSQSVAYGTQLAIEAFPGTGYDFDTWSDNVADNPRTITVTGDITLSASFQIQEFTVTLTAGTNGLISVNSETATSSYSGTATYGSTVTVEAVPNTGFNFTQWSDGNTDNPRTITVTSNVYLTSAYATQLFTVTVEPDPNCPVYVNGHEYTTTYTRSDVRYGENYVIEARPATGYSWVGWNDGSTTNPRILQITNNVSLTPSVTVSEYWVWVTPGANGTTEVNGTAISGTYHQKHTYGSTVTLEATPDAGYQFDGWGDGNTDNPRTITVTGAVNVTSSYSIQEYWVEIIAGQNGSVSVNGVGGNYSASVPAGTQLTIEAIPTFDYDFTAWSDGVSTNPRTLTVNADTTLTAAFQEQAQPSALNTIRYTTTDSQVNSTWLTAYDSDNNALTPTETNHYGRIVYGEPVHKIVVNTNNASNIESITTSYKTEVVDCSGLSNLTNCTSLTLKSPHMTSVNFTPFTALQNLWCGHANDDAQYTGVSNLPASGACTTRTDNNLWEHSDLSGWTFQALGTVITYEAEEQMDLTDHNVYNRHTEGVQPVSHTFADGVGTITYDETVGELRDNWQGCDKLYIPDTVGYFDYCEYLPQAMEVGEYFGVVGGSMYAGEDWAYTHLFHSGIQPDCAVTVYQDNPILTIGTDGCLYNKEGWMGLNIVNMNGTTLDMDDRCVDASTCMFTEIKESWPYTITRLTLGNNCESLKLYDLHSWERGLVIGEFVLNDALQSFNPNRQQIGHASGGSNNPYLNVTNSGYTIESEDGSTLYWCGDASADLSDYTHFAECCCAYLSFSSMPDISSATQVDRDAFHNISGVSTWVWPDNNIVFNGRHIIRNESNITRIEFGSHSVTFNNNEGEGLFECWNLNTIVFNSQLIPTQLDQDNYVFQELPPVGTVYIPLGSDYSTFLNYGGNAANIGLWTVKYIMDNTQLAIKHTPGVTITAPTLTGLTMVASADSNGWLKVTYSGDITAYDSTELQNNTDVLEIVLPDSCLSVGNGAFLGCSNLAKVTVSDSCTSIGNSAFYGTAISEFSAKGVTSFGSGAFGNCTSLTSVEFGENLATLGNGLFYNCSSLEYVGFDGATGPTITNNDLGSGIHATGTIYIPRYANDASYADFIAAMPVGWTVIRRKQNQILYQTTNNQKLDDVPNGLMYNVKLLKHTYFNGWGVLEYSGDKLHGVQDFLPGRTTLSYISLPEMDGPVDYTSFSGCTSLTSVEVEDCTYIEYDAFRDCPITDFPTANTLIVPASTQFVAEGAYSDFGGTTIMFNPALTRLSGNTINLQNATDIYVCGTNTMEDWGDPFTNTPASGTLHLPTYMPFARYWENYLPGWTKVYDITILEYTSSDNKKIAPLGSAFDVTLVYNYCDDSGNGVLCFGDRLTKIGANAFNGCTNMSSLKINKVYTTNTVTTIGSQAFANTGLTSINLPNTATNLAGDAFIYTDLTSIKIVNGPNGSSSSDGTLYSYYNLTERNLLARVSHNSNSVRNDTVKVGTSTANIPGTVMYIGDNAFRGNKAVTSVTFSECQMGIGSYAFKDCSNLRELHFTNTNSHTPTVGTDTFSGVRATGTVYGRSGYSYTDIMAALPSGWHLIQN